MIEVNLWALVELEIHNQREKDSPIILMEVPRIGLDEK